MGVLLIVLAAVALVNLIVLGVVLLRSRDHRREREEQLAQRAAEQAMERGLEKVRGREWLRAHRH